MSTQTTVVLDLAEVVERLGLAIDNILSLLHCAALLMCDMNEKSFKWFSTLICQKNYRSLQNKIIKSYKDQNINIALIKL